MKAINKDNMLFKNEFISIVENDTRLDVFDSDSRYIDYFFYYDDYEDQKNKKVRIQEIIAEVSTMGEDDLVRHLCGIFDIFKVERFCGDNETMSELREQWGDEWVVRIGNAVLIIKE